MMWTLAGKQLTSRLLLGTAQYPSLQVMQQAIAESQTQVITVSIKRQQAAAPNQSGGHAFWNHIKDLHCHILPNTAGCRSVQEAVTMAEIARELFQTDWIKLEIMGDDFSLQPDPFELLTAAKILLQKGFEVFPYCTEDLVLCQRLFDAGCKVLMPWGAPIGSAKGLVNPYGLEILRTRLPEAQLIIDAGIGRPSHAVQAMELGFDGVLLNSAVALAIDPVRMAAAFRDAVHAGRVGYEAGILPERNCAYPSTPLQDTPFWQQNTCQN